MAKVVGVPGEWARVKGVVMGLWPLMAWIFMSGFALAVILMTGFVASGLFMLAMAAMLVVWCARQGLRKVESFFKGAKGEERIAAILEELPEDCWVFHDYQAGADHIDHVVVSPGGIYSVETKFWNGKVTVDDDCILVDGKLPTRSPVSQAQRERNELRSKFKGFGWNVDVLPVVVFASDTFEPGFAELDGVTVLNSSRLKKWLSERVPVLTEIELARLSKLMEE